MSDSITKFDPRLLSVEIQIRDQLTVFNEDFAITVSGTKYANSLQNTCDIQIANMATDKRDYLLTETSPFNANKTPKVCNVKAGRVSSGLFLVYSGNIMTTGIKQPPDIMLQMKCGTGHFQKGRVGTHSGGASTDLHTLARSAAANLGLSPRLEVPNMNVANYHHSGNALGEVGTLGESGNCLAYVDDAHLILKPINVALSGPAVEVSEETGMVGVPEVTEQGLKVTFLFDSAAKLGGGIIVKSKLNPAANGTFVIYKLSFKLSSRDTEFYYTAECLQAKG